MGAPPATLGDDATVEAMRQCYHVPPLRLGGPVFGPLRDPEQFKRFKIQRHTLSWDNGADFGVRARVTPG